MTSAPNFICWRTAKRHSSGPLHTPSSGPAGGILSGWNRRTVTVPTGRTDGVAGDQDARPFGDPVPDGIAQRDVDEIRSPDLAQRWSRRPSIARALRARMERLFGTEAQRVS